MKEYSNRNEGQMIFKNIFEYHTKGLLNDSEFCELMDLIYEIRWDIENYKPTNASEKVQMIWQGIAPTFKKSKSNAEYYDKKQNEKIEHSTKVQTEQEVQKEEINENNLQLFLGFLQDRKPQKNQTLNLLLNSNSSISGFCWENKINRSTQEKAWEIYKQQ